MTRTAIEQFLQRHRAAFERRDVDALAALHTPDGVLDSPAYGVVRGRDAIREVYRYWYRAFPDFLVTWDHPIIDPPYAAYLWKFEGTSQGPFFGEVRMGTRIAFVGATENMYTEEGISSTRHIFDFSGTLVRLGVLKVKPS
jgi:hypothetical protein